MKSWIVNTRPESVQKITNKIISKHGFNPISLPLIEINFLSLGSDTLRSLVCKQCTFVFTSQFAASGLFKFLQSQQLMDDSLIISVGKKTTQTLESHTKKMVFTPKVQNSEGVVDLLKGFKKVENIVVIGGVGGRNIIERYAVDNEIQYTKIDIYKRDVITPSDGQIADFIAIEDVFILATSVTTLLNLKACCEGQNWQKLATKNLICSSKRIADKALNLGYLKVANAGSSDIDEMMVYIKSMSSKVEAH